MDNLIFNVARGNGKTSVWVYTMALDYISRKKKKKAFLKFLRSLGHKQTIIKDYVEHITLVNRSGIREEYSYTGFMYFMMTNYCCCERRS